MATRTKKTKSPTVVPSEAPAAAHDTRPPAKLLAFMRQGWKEKAKKLPPKVKGHENFLARRNAVSARFPGEVVIVPTGHEKVRANDTNYRFRPGSDFYYLTGNVEADCVLVLEPVGKGHKHVLFVEPNPGRSDDTFYLDRNKGELWVGPRLGVPESQARFGMDACRGLSELPEYLASLRGATARPFRLLRGFSESVEARLPAQRERDQELGTFLSEMRLLKDALEIRELQGAIDSTKRGFEDVIERLAQGESEREVEGVFNLRARVEGNDVGYGTIAASGANACILHWTRNDAKLKAGDLLLLDAGVERDTLYTADITRTLPISGKFSKEQKEIYELVLEAQDAAFAAVKPRNDFMEPNRVAMVVLAKGLERLGILDSAEEALADENQFYKRYSLHNVSHMLGLDVHDCAQARAESYKFGKLQAGMVLTVEPGLYFQLDDLTVPAKYRGIGVRIEDDVVVTARGCKVLSADIPRTTKEVEAWMASIWKQRKARPKKA
ncbi:aminopeptidase P family protein [Vulgatibacter incomptus]|uniref:Xaa-Pro aminopeptidase n=1 Tax=Vulgatibacter incomptus TaxID=1391653 RepID=A0A0K1PI28_9BACT|nr:aminopeptidase P family protein [Vulgatibacter incomptus]AKU93180.1 Xaa-Pro aminopeptidase [Vulgatibacter incomptus]